MSTKSNRFKRPLGKRAYKKIFIISVEGRKTEPQYFYMLEEQHATVKINCLKSSLGKNSPIHVLERIKNYLRKNELRTTDEASTLCTLF